MLELDGMQAMRTGKVSVRHNKTEAIVGATQKISADRQVIWAGNEINEFISVISRVRKDPSDGID